MSDQPIKVKIAPNSKESEMMVLGCMLTSINALNIASDNLNDSDFYYTEHKIIFGVLKEAFKSDRPADVHLICEELKRREKLDAVGGPAYLTTLAQYAGTSAHIEEYCRIVQDKSVLRRMIQAAQKVEKEALAEPKDVHETLDEAQQLFFQISQSSNQHTGVLVRDILSGVRAESQKPYLKALQERQEEFQLKGHEEAGITGLRTHFADLDKMLNGFNNSNLMILAARPAMGKTALALNIAENICFKTSTPVGIFSLEMSAEQLVHRIICSQSEVESDKIKTGAINGVEYQRIVAAVNEIQGQPMIIDDQPGLKVTDLRARARRMKESYGIGFLIIDYLQLISGSGSNRSMESRQIEVSEISRMLKNLARELDVPILCLSQLSRKVEERQGHRPMMSDLRESGCLAADTEIQDADNGKIYTIKELAERKEQTPIKVFAVNKDYKIGKHTMSKVFYSGKKTTYLLKTRTGRTIKASANHPFLKLEGWTCLDRLKEGDRIATPRKLEGDFASEMENEELALLAHLLGDGCILPNQPYHYTSADKENIKIVGDAAKKLFGIQPKVVTQNNWQHLYLPSPIRLTHGKKHPITNWYSKLGIERVRSYDKKIPKEVFCCSKDQITHFLHHLWATDGSITEKKLQGRKPSASIYYASSSQVLGKQVQNLLLRVDIQSTISACKSSKGYRTMYHVAVQGSNHQKRFLKTIGSAGSRGSQAALLIERLDEIEPHYNYDVIPKEAWKSVISQAKDSLGIGWREVSKLLGMSYCGSTLFRAGISRNRMQRLYKALGDNRLKVLAYSDIYWDEIVSITELGEEDVYDATVDEVHNFVANDIIVHNSLEQDSDIVMFLLRREYYDPMDKPGMAELIVGKNRHGPVGTVNLTYRKEFAQFVNYTPIQFQNSEPVFDKEAEEQFSHFTP